jgi:hypothetical protein
MIRVLRLLFLLVVSLVVVSFASAASYLKYQKHGQTHYMCNSEVNCHATHTCRWIYCPASDLGANVGWTFDPNSYTHYMQNGKMSEVTHGHWNGADPVPSSHPNIEKLDKKNQEIEAERQKESKQQKELAHQNGIARQNEFASQTELAHKVEIANRAKYERREPTDKSTKTGQKHANTYMDTFKNKLENELAEFEAAVRARVDKTKAISRELNVAIPIAAAVGLITEVAIHGSLIATAGGLISEVVEVMPTVAETIFSSLAKGPPIIIPTMTKEEIDNSILHVMGSKLKDNDRDSGSKQSPINTESEPTDTSVNTTPNEKNKGFTGGKSHTSLNKEIKGVEARVDWEEPTGGSTGNVHVQTKGRGGDRRYYLDDPKKLDSLPKRLSEDRDIQRAIERSFKQLNNLKP